MKYFRFLTILMIAATLAFTACDSDDSTTPDVDVTFISAVEIGGNSETVDSTGLILTFDVDPENLTADNITVTGATKGELSGSGTTWTLAISDITVANGAEVSVTITSPDGYSITGSPKTAVVYRAPYIGMAYQGGIIAYIYQDGDNGYVDGETHGIIAAASDMDISGTQTFQWGGRGADMDGTGYTTGEEIGDGESNTETIVYFFDTIEQSSEPNATYYAYEWDSLESGTVAFIDEKDNTYPMDYRNNGDVAAKLCADYEVDVSEVTYDDWYLPSKDELYELYTNRAAIGGFTWDPYWSSSEGAASLALAKGFYDGYQASYPKTNDYRVRAVRAF